MQTKRQTGTTPNHLTESVDLKKIFYSLSALLVTFTLYPASPGMAAGFDGKLNAVTITDSAGVNAPPTAVIDYSLDGDMVNFDGSGSSDADGSLVSYSWDFGDGTTGTGETVSHTFAGVITPVTLTVIDNSGGAALSQVVATTSTLAFSDDFSTDTRGGYTVANTWTKGGTGQFNYDAAGQRLRIVAGDDVGLQFAKSLPVSSSGTFSLDFLPTKIYPAGGIVVIRLRQDNSNFYEVKYSDGYASGIIRKVVNGTEVAITQDGTQYKQNINYNIGINFSPAQVSVQGFGPALTLNSNSADIKVSSFEVEVTQQDSYFDNLEFIR